MGEFEERLQKAIDETLSLLGPVGKHNLCLKLKEVFQLEPGKMAGDPERLSLALDQIIGRAGQVLGRAIAQRLAKTYSIRLSQDHDLTYADHIRHIRRLVQSRSLQTACAEASGIEVHRKA